VGQASPVIFQGAGSASTSISPAAANAILAQGDAVITINGVKLSSGAGSCILAIDAGTIVNQGTDVNIGASPSYQLFTQYGGKINVTASYTVSGSSANGHFENYGGQTVVTAGITITFVGTLSFGAFASADFSGGALFAAGITFAGSFASVTGTKYGAQYGGLVFTQGAGINYFPGSIAGSALAGGIYA
jgi:hypothetical protein